MKAYRHLIIILILLVSASVSHAQSPQEKASLKKERFRKIEFFHASFGADFSANKSFYASPTVSLGIGSYRNLLNADIGLKYKLGNPIFFDDEEHLVPQQLLAFASLQLNAFSWKSKCLFIGGEIAYNIPIAALHYLPSSNIIEYDKQVGCRHFSTQIDTGIMLDQWSISLFYEYDLAPSLNQKYVYESVNFDYDHLHDILFERSRFGVSVTYHLPFNL